MTKLKIASSQFAINADINKNYDTIIKQMCDAKKNRADVIHFCETALSAYAGCEVDSYKHLDWNNLKDLTNKIMAKAKELNLWVILGSAHPLTGKNKPHNSLYIINNKGKLIDRYDKRFCTGDKQSKSGDLKHYSPGNHFTVFSIKGIKCGALICHDFRYQELYREYKKNNVKLMFHSYHNINNRGDFHISKNNIHGIIVPPTMQTYAANNYMWISSTNCSTKQSCWSSFFVQPDGVIIGKLPRNKAGILYSTIDTTDSFYDASANWRSRAMKGIYNSGKAVTDKRSNGRKFI